MNVGGVWAIRAPPTIVNFNGMFCLFLHGKKVLYDLILDLYAAIIIFWDTPEAPLMHIQCAIFLGTHCVCVTGIFPCFTHNQIQHAKCIFNLQECHTFFLLYLNSQCSATVEAPGGLTVFVGENFCVDNCNNCHGKEVSVKMYLSLEDILMQQ